MRLLQKQADVSATITSLFAHSRESGTITSKARESIRFFTGLKEVMALQYG